MLPLYMRTQAVGDFLCSIEAAGRVLLRDSLIRNAARLAEVTPGMFVEMQRWAETSASAVIAQRGETETPELRSFYARVILTVLLYEWADRDWPAPGQVPSTQPHP